MAMARPLKTIVSTKGVVLNAQPQGPYFVENIAEIEAFTVRTRILSTHPKGIGLTLANNLRVSLGMRFFNQYPS